MVLTSLYVGYRIGARPNRDEDELPEVVEEDNVKEEPEPVEPIWDGDLAAIKAGKTDQCKMASNFFPCQFSTHSDGLQVLVVRSDLKMKPGDISCQ